MRLLDDNIKGAIQYYMPDHTTAQKLATFFDMFSDVSRIRILSALAFSEMCVSDLAELLSMNQTTLSHQLRNLKDNGVVYSVRIGKSVFYRISNDGIEKLLSCGTEICFK